MQDFCEGLNGGLFGEPMLRWRIILNERQTGWQGIRWNHVAGQGIAAGFCAYGNELPACTR